MESNIRCPICGVENPYYSRFCHNCGNEIANKENIGNTIKKEDPTTPNILAALSLIFYYGSTIIYRVMASLIPSSSYIYKNNNYSFGLTSFVELLPLAGIVTMIVGRIKYPNNKFLKAVMWMMICTTVLYFIIVAWFLIWCYTSCT